MAGKTSEDLARLVERETRDDDRLVAAFRRVPRADFVPPEARELAYRDRPIPIPEHQTTTQPTLIARMIHAASVGGTDRVLEVGTGYGFQTALLAELAGSVVSVERYSDLLETARSNLERAGIEGVELVLGDGWSGHPEGAPYDAIVVSAAAPRIPPALAEQLAEGGRLVIPLSGPLGDEVWLHHKRAAAVERVRLVTPARFVPLVEGPP
jgi:protein-L-isoaspartate(D-aspartate) O-methyltransferase